MAGTVLTKKSTERITEKVTEKVMEKVTDFVMPTETMSTDTTKMMILTNMKSMKKKLLTKVKKQ